jgi:hypothetical protein
MIYLISQKWLEKDLQEKNPIKIISEVIIMR